MLPVPVQQFVRGTLLTSLLAMPLRGQAADSTAPKLAITGYLQVRETYQRGTGLSATINRARFALAGRITDGLTFRVGADLRAATQGLGKASVAMLDAFVRYATPNWAVQGGQFKTPFAREYVTTITNIETAERSTVVDSLAPKRDIGVMGELFLGHRVTVSLGIFNGEGVNVTANRDSTLLGVGRVVVRPVDQLAIGVDVASYLGDSTRYGVDMGYETRRLTLRGEYLRQHRNQGQAPEDHGWYALAAYFLFPSVQLVGKLEELNRPVIGPDAINKGWTVGLNVFVRPPTAKFTLDYLSRRINSTQPWHSQLIGQFQVKI